MPTCTPDDINYQLCAALVARLDEQQTRLDLIWYGGWALVGLTLVALVFFALRAVFS